MINPMSEIGWSFFSDIDYQSILDKYREALEAQYLKPIEEKAIDINEKNAAILDVKDSLEKFKSTVESLFSDTGISAKKVSVSDETVLTASVSDNVATGIYYVKVNQIATVDQWLSANGVTDPYDTSDSSNIVLTNGESFSFKYHGVEVKVMADGNWPLSDLVNALNSKADELGLHVAASIIKVGDDFKLMLTGEDTGADFTITNISNNSTLGNGDDYTHLQTAQDAKVEFGNTSPITITSPNNSFELVDGLTITLKKDSPSTVIIDVQNDIESLKQKIHDFVDAYNELVDKIKSYTEFDEGTYETGPLFGESYVADLRAALIDLVLTNVDVDATFTENWGGDNSEQELHNLAQLGIDFDSEGHLKVKDYKLEWYLENHFDAVKKLFTATGGLIDKVTEKIDRITDPTTGFIALIQETYQSKLDLYKSQHEKAQKEVDAELERMQEEFLKLEQIKSQMEQMQNTLKAYFDVGEKN
ncbi:flagellar filament capping protein FliD [Desulfurobacterium crinifex]